MREVCDVEWGEGMDARAIHNSCEQSLIARGAVPPDGRNLRFQPAIAESADQSPPVDPLAAASSLASAEAPMLVSWSRRLDACDTCDVFFTAGSPA